MTYQTRRREKNIPVSGAEKAKPAAPAVHAPSIEASQGGAGAQLDELMQARMQRFMRHQIPKAEQEADRIAAEVTSARTPQEVKAQLGETMGADFSNVRFHTGADAATKAGSIGARAYATGSDIYFGEGGFDPAVAAHELVHTTQQGVVDSAVSTASAPMGGVQMMPSWKDFKRGVGNIGHVIAGGARMAGHGISTAAKAVGRGTAAMGKTVGRGAAAVGKGIGSVASSAWNGITGLFKSDPRSTQPIPSPAFQFNPGQGTQEETTQYANLDHEAATEYQNATVGGGTKQEQYIRYLADHNRNNANFSGFKQSSARLRNGQAMKNMTTNVGVGLSRQFGDDSGKKRLERYGTMNKDSILTDKNGAKDTRTFSGSMMDQMDLLLDDPEMQRYILGNAHALRGATAGKEGEQNFFGDDHILANTLLNNLNLYMMNPTVGFTGRTQIGQTAGMTPDQSGIITKFSQASTTMFNYINSLHAGMGTGDLSEEQLSQMATDLRAGKGSVVSDETIIQNLMNQPKNHGRDPGSFTPKEMNGMRAHLREGHKSDAYDDATLMRYHTLYQKMRALIGPQQ